MSYNLVDPTTGDLTRVAGGIDTSIIPSNASASNKLVTNTQLTSKMSCYTWGTDKTLKAVFYEITDRGILADVNDTVGKRIIARYGNVLINRITQLNGIKNFYWDNTLVLSCPWNDDTTKLTAILEIFAGATSWQQLATTDSTLKTIQLSGSVDCNTLIEPGLYTASAGAVISITNTPSNIGSAVQLDGGFSVLVTKTNVDSVYYGMQMFIPYGSDVPFIRKSYYLNGQYWTPWEQVATMDKIANSIIREGKSTLYNLNNVDNIEVAIDVAKSGYKPIAVSLFNAGTHLWFAQGIYFNDTICNVSLRGSIPTSATNAECEVLVTYIKTS